MAEELTRVLERRAERGDPRGAAAVLADAQRQLAVDAIRRPSWRSGPAIAVATAAAVLLVVGGALLAMRLLVSDTVSPSVTSTVPPTPQVRVDELIWSRVTADDAVFADARMESVAVFKGGLVAVGESVDGAAVWTSPDGVTWDRVSLEPPPGTRGWFRDVSPGGPGLVAIVEVEADVEVDAVWTSPDGIAWTQSDQTFDSLEAITHGGPGLVVVGDGMVYTSVDGMDWTAAQCPDCSETGEFGYVADVTAGGPGLIAIGNATAEGTGAAFFWTSPDGLTWTRVVHDAAVEMESVTAGGPGFVAVGHSSGRAEVLTSPDGRDWSRVRDDEEVFGRSLMRTVVTGGDGLVALGEWDWGEGQAWVSGEGIVWTRVPYDATVFGGSSVHDAVVFRDRIVAVGSRNDPGDDEEAAVWVAATPGSSQVTPTTSAGTPPTMRPLVTGDATNPWRKTEITELWASRIVDVTSLPDGGFVLAVGEGGSILWSQDGVGWQEADPNGHVAPLQPVDEIEGARVIAALPDRVAVLGGAGAERVVWIGNLATGVWRSIPLETDGLGDHFEIFVIAANDHEVLVVAKSYWDHVALEYSYLAWLIDPETERIDRSTLPSDFHRANCVEPFCRIGLEAEWFGDRWVVAAGNTTAVSEDGRSWTTRSDDDGLGAEDRYVTSLSAGPDSIVATTCGGWGPHLVWYSEDGLDWAQAPDVPGPHSGYAHSDTLGFVAVSDGRVFSSTDGQTWHWTLGPGGARSSQGIRDIAASGNSVFVVADSPFLLTSDEGRD